jgi:hypothetical protein
MSGAANRPTLPVQGQGNQSPPGPPANTGRPPDVGPPADTGKPPGKDLPLPAERAKEAKVLSDPGKGQPPAQAQAARAAAWGRPATPAARDAARVERIAQMWRVEARG